MPGCAAIGCNNRSEKGYSMKCFPRDPVLRQIWQDKVGRANWEPSKNSFLCHDHFEPSQWTQMENGKIKLRRDAMPSIFKETSTRKSPRKRRIENGIQIANIFSTNPDNTMKINAVQLPDGDESEDNNYNLEYLDDCEYEVAFAAVGNPKANFGNSKIVTTENIAQELKKNYGIAYQIVTEKDIKQLEKENIIIVSDEHDREIGKLIHNNESIIIVSNENNEEIGQILVEDDSIVRQNNSVADIQEQENYDEIEERMKLICNGENDGVALPHRAERAEPEPEAGKERKDGDKPLSKKDGDIRSNNSMAESKFHTEITGNVETIFGTESSDENGNNDGNSTPKKLELKVSAGNREATKNTMKRKERPEAMQKIETPSGNSNHKSVEDSLQVGKITELHKTTKTPVKPRRRIKEDVMRSIERAIGELSERAVRSVQNDQLTRSILRIARARKKGNRKQSSGVSCAYKRPSDMIEDKFELVGCDSPSKKSKFTIKVTGVADDVNKIIERLDTNSMKLKTDKNTGGNSSSKYILAEEINEQDLIRIDSRFIECDERDTEDLKSDNELSSDFDSIDFAEGCMVDQQIEEEFGKSNRNEISEIVTLFNRNKEFIHTEEFDPNIKRKKLLGEENLRPNIEHRSSEDENNQTMRLKHFSKSQDPSRELRQKINAQQEVIGKLTNQLIIYKGLEAKLAKLSFQLLSKNKEIASLKDKLEKNPQISVQDQSVENKDTDDKEKTISNLSNKINGLKEANKKLMQQISTESHNKKLAHHLKQKDDQIKELKWKLEKASKFLDRAEKNTNTFRRKMVSMQTAMRRQKASEEKRNHFHELLIDNAKHEFSESALLTAMDIKNSCGIKCYEKLLSYNFPLPSFRTLRRRFQKENIVREDGEAEAEAEGEEPIVNSEDQNDTTFTEIFQTSELGETEVTGTVQDIFEESNDTEELNSSEIGEQILAQLSNESKYVRNT